MRYLFFLLIFPIFASAGDQNPQCGEVKKMAEGLEKKIQSLNLKPEDNCSGSSTDYRCKDYSAVESRLKSIQNELALFRGVYHVKVGVSPQEAISKNPATFAKDSQKFYLNLKVASELELFLKSGDFLSNVASEVREKKITDPKEFHKILTQACKEFNIKASLACDKKDADVLNEIMGAVTVGSESVGKFDTAQIEELSKALALKRGEETLTYSDLLKDIKDPGNGSLTDIDVAKLQGVVGFFGKTKFKFLPNVAGIVEPETPMKIFSSTVTSLLDRQQFEMKSKLSLIMSQFKDSKAKLAESEIKACEGALLLDIKNGYEKDLKLCLDGMKADAGLQTFQKSTIEDMKQELFSAGYQLQNLNRCIPVDEVLDTACNALTSERLAELMNQEATLLSIQAELQEKSKGLLKMRNYTLEKLYSYECMQDTESIIEVCTEDDNISRESVVLSGEVNEILYVMDKPVKGSETVIADLCADQEVVVPFKDKICALKSIEEKEEADKKEQEREAKEKMARISSDNDIPVAQAPRDRTFDNLVGLVGRGFQNHLNQNRPNPYTNIPPYSYPVNAGGARGTYDAVSGIGSYRPTPGLRPYSSINSNVGLPHAYVPAPSMSFKSPIGW